MRVAMRLAGLLWLGVAIGIALSFAPVIRGGGLSPEPALAESSAATTTVVPDAGDPSSPEPRKRKKAEKPQMPGLLTFRGNATRTYYGKGPIPDDPAVAWRYPGTAMCSESTVAGETKEWCGTGWTGQPAVFERDGLTWLVFGAYDGQVHFVDAASGHPLLPPFQTGDIIKGSVSVDPDGYPLVYVGSRDDHYRVLSIDGPAAEELWALSADAVSPTLWNNDWDSSGVIVDDHLLIGGENSQLHIVKLNRGYAGNGQVTVAPQLVFNAPGWDQQLLDDLGDSNVSIEGSLTLVDDVLYFANSGGLVQGWNLAGLESGRDPRRVFRFWTGDDTDATIVADDEGMLYVASQWERHTTRAAAVGQIMKLDPSRPRDPLVWSVADRSELLAGVWATPALHGDMLYVPTHGGDLLGIDRGSGEVRWRESLPGPVWSSPVVVDDVLVQGDCAGVLHAYDVSDTSAAPSPLWDLPLGGCIESTPAVWDGSLYVGTRAGFVVGVR